MKYVIVTGSLEDIERFTAAVSDMLSGGWQCLGGATSPNGHMLMQTMVITNI